MRRKNRWPQLHPTAPSPFPLQEQSAGAAGKLLVKIGDFLPKGSLLAPGVVDADEQIRPGDEVIVVGEKAFGVGRARMSGWEMKASRRGVAVEMRHVVGQKG